MLLRWAAAYADGREVSGQLPGDLPGAAVPRPGLRRFTLSQGTPDVGWAPILAVDLADHERLIFRRRMATDAFAAASPAAVALIVGSYDPHTDRSSLLYLHGDGTMSLRVAMADVAPEPHEVG